MQISEDNEHAPSVKVRSPVAAICPGSLSPVRELVRTNNVVLLSWVSALLADAGIEAIVLDVHTSVIEGSLGILPRRLMVADDDHAQAQGLLADAGQLPPSA